MIHTYIITTTTTTTTTTNDDKDHNNNHNHNDNDDNSNRLPDGVGTNRVFSEGPQISQILQCVASSAHTSPHFAAFSHES